MDPIGLHRSTFKTPLDRLSYLCFHNSSSLLNELFLPSDIEQFLSLDFYLCTIFLEVKWYRTGIPSIIRGVLYFKRIQCTLQKHEVQTTALNLLLKSARIGDRLMTTRSNNIAKGGSPSMHSFSPSGHYLCQTSFSNTSAKMSIHYHDFTTLHKLLIFPLYTYH